MFTPQEVSEKAFPKSSGFGGGYQMAAVDEFLDALTEDYTALFKDNVALKAKLKVLAEKVEEYRSTEDSMRATLVTAQKMAAKLVQEAQDEKDQMLVQARRDAADEIARLDAETEEAKARLSMARQSLADFIARSNDLIRAQSSFLAALPEAEVPKTVSSPVEDTVGAIEAEIERVMDIPAAEMPTAEEDPMDCSTRSFVPSDFELSLEGLKFGRNYTGESDA